MKLAGADLGQLVRRTHHSTDGAHVRRSLWTLLALFAPATVSSLVPPRDPHCNIPPLPLPHLPPRPYRAERSPRHSTAQNEHDQLPDLDPPISDSRSPQTAAPPYATLNALPRSRDEHAVVDPEHRNFQRDLRTPNSAPETTPRRRWSSGDAGGEACRSVGSCAIEAVAERRASCSS